LFQLPRPFTNTDGAVTQGLLDPTDVAGEEELADKMKECSARLRDGVLTVLPEGRERLAAALADRTVGDCHTVTSSSLLPHEAAPTGVLVALDGWLAERT